MKFVLGFLFRKENTEVALIKKVNPEEQRGLLNGIGGKMDKGPEESVTAAQVREFREETGALIVEDDWREFLTVDWPGGGMTCFYSLYGDGVEISQQPGEVEVPAWYSTKEILRGDHKTMDNIPMLIHVALSGYEGRVATAC